MRDARELEVVVQQARDGSALPNTIATNEHLHYPFAHRIDDASHDGAPLSSSVIGGGAHRSAEGRNLPAPLSSRSIDGKS